MPSLKQFAISVSNAIRSSGKYFSINKFIPWKLLFVIIPNC
jgi:hypothetical protein